MWTTVSKIHATDLDNIIKAHTVAVQQIIDCLISVPFVPNVIQDLS